MSVKIDRTSKVGIRYVADEDIMKMKLFCVMQGIPESAIKFRKQTELYYVRLKGKKVLD
jgi:hypothetical protein